MVLSTEEKQKTNPGLSAVLSFLFNGLGQIYNGQIGKGLTIITFSSLSMFFLLIGAVFTGRYLLSVSFSFRELILGLTLLIIGIILIAILGIYSIRDAYNVARKKLLE